MQGDEKKCEDRFGLLLYAQTTLPFSVQRCTHAAGELVFQDIHVDILGIYIYIYHVLVYTYV